MYREPTIIIGAKSISINQYKVNKVRHNKVAANIGSPQGATHAIPNNIPLVSGGY